MMADAADYFSESNTLVGRAGGLHPPPEVMMVWPTPNRIDPEERGWEAPISLVIVLGITFLVYAARMWARIVIAKNVGVDDLLMSIAMLPLFGLTIFVALGKLTIYVVEPLLSIKSDQGVRVPMTRLGSD